MNNNRIIYFVSGTIFLLLVSCCTSYKEAEVTITKDYVINPNWDDVANSFDVIKMKLKDSSENINVRSVSPPELLQKLVKDTTFVYSANVSFNGTKYSERKVYFDKDNGFLWWGNLYKSSSSKKVLGELQENTWYLLTGLSNIKTLYYVYIDKDSIHSIKVPASYWTNY